MDIYLVALSFLLGSIPFGYIIVKLMTGKDIRREGSGNIGSTNVKRVAGKKISVLVQILDILKGLIPVLVYKANGSNDINSICIIAIVSVIGHIFSPFLGFKGGKGINTTLGAFVLICPIPIIISVVLHISLKTVTKIVSIRSIILSLAIPIISYCMDYNIVIVQVTFVAAILIIYAHRENIIRILNNKEC